MAPRDEEARAALVTCVPDGVQCATSRTESIAVVGKAWVEQRAQDLQDGLGHEPVKDRRDTEHPRPTRKVRLIGRPLMRPPGGRN